MTTRNELTHLAKFHSATKGRAWQVLGVVGTQKSLDSFNECNQIGAETNKLPQRDT